MTKQPKPTIAYQRGWGVAPEENPPPLYAMLRDEAVNGTDNVAPTIRLPLASGTLAADYVIGEPLRLDRFDPEDMIDIGLTIEARLAKHRAPTV